MAFMLMCIGLLKMSRKLGMPLSYLEENSELDAVDDSALEMQIKKFREAEVEKNPYDDDGRIIMQCSELWTPRQLKAKSAIHSLGEH